MKRYISASLGSELDKYQKWVDYDMKRYGRISDKTNEEIDKAGLEIVKDKYGDYEVIASRRSIKASLSEDIERYQEWVDYDMERYGKISEDTNREIKEAGLKIVKDKYGDYEVIA